MPLTSPRFKDNARLQSAARNSPPMCFPETGQAVRLVQQALIDSGYPLPVSVKKYGSPDGVYGNETKAQIVKYQTNNGLQVDGITGKQTLEAMDAALRGPVPALPPLNNSANSGYVNYTVPGLFVPLKQKSGMSCWATMYTMMVSWKDQMSYPVETAVEQLGPPYPKILADDTGLPITENVRLAGKAGMTAEPLFNPSAQGWAELLHKHGLLWTSFAWQVTAATGGLVSGRHIIILYGIQGDGTQEGTIVKYVDPADGMKHVETFKKYIEGHELGFTITNLSDQELTQFSQIMHY